MTLRSDLLKVMQAVEESTGSPLSVTQAGVQCFDFILKRGNSMIAVMDSFDKLHREHYTLLREVAAQEGE